MSTQEEEKKEEYDWLVKETKPFDDQKPGTSGLRKKVKRFQEENYLENFIQSIFDSLDRTIGCTLVLGGDGRYHNDVAIETILRMAAANQVKKMYVGLGGLMTTPNVSQVIRELKAYGAIILTASHNPAGPDEDFGVKYNVENGGPAMTICTQKIFETSKKIATYKITKQTPDWDINKVGKYSFAGMEIEVIDAPKMYVKMMKEIFDFDTLKEFVNRDDFSMVYDSMHGVAGPFAKAIFNGELGLDEKVCMNAEPKPDFNGGHPDPNLKYAHDLVDIMGLNPEHVPDEKEIPDFGAAADGDADRNMIVGKKFFVTPSDSVAIIAANYECIPYFKDGLKGVARSMPTSGALDFVAKKLDLKFFETPTGWKYFGNLMENGDLSICGEESFGTGSDHVREKDGIWAVLCWLSIMAHRNKDSSKALVSVEDIVMDHWKEYGRNYYTRYDYETVEKAGAEKLFDHLREHAENFTDGKVEKTLDDFTIDKADEFEYTDPVDKSVATRQGMRFIMTDNSRIIFRLSGTGSVGATIRLYIEKYEAKDGNLTMKTADALAPLVKIALELSKMEEFTGRKEPTVIT